MKTKNVLLIGIMCFFMMFHSGISIYAQEPIDHRTQQLDLKLQLLDSKLDLLDSKIKLWESKPEELDIRLDELDERIRTLAFNPQELNSKFNKIDSMIRELEKTELPPVIPERYIQERELEYHKDYRSAIMMDPVRLFEGTFQLSYERLITDKLSVGLSGLATYATEEGLTNYFFSNQTFNYFDAMSDSYIDYKGESIAGGGIILQCRDYLLADYSPRKKPPAGLYAAPQLLYRRILITGEHMEFVEEEEEWVEKEIKQRLNVFAAGAVIGARIPFMKVLFVDLFVGGNIRLSKYDKEAGFTKYKDWYNIDFSGVFPTAGVGVGILK